MSYSTSLIGVVTAIMLATAADSARASGDCSEQWVCVEVEQDGDSVEFIARNLQPYPLTLTLDTRHSNLKADRRLPVTLTVDGHGSRTLVRMKTRNSRRDYGFRYWFDWTVGRMNARHDKDYVYRLPFAAGERYYVIQGFGSRFSHTGLEQYAVDFDMPEGTAVHAAREGTVAMVVEEHDRGCWKDDCARYANYIVVLHDDGTTGEYYHLQRHGALVEPGQRIARGQLIGRSGNTGHTTMPHLHFAVYRAVEWGRTQSIKVRFDTGEGAVDRIRAGRQYLAR